jgi:hypothetical protein
MSRSAFGDSGSAGRRPSFGVEVLRMSTELSSAVTCEHAGHRLTFTCEPALHLVVVCAGTDAPGVAFGGFGRQPGAFDTPIDVALVQPEFFGEAHSMADTDSQYLAVADYGNARVQIFELDGSLVATLDEGFESIGRPTRLTWRAPFLQVEGLDGASIRIHVGAALLAHHAAAPCATLRAFRAPGRQSWNVC